MGKRKRNDTSGSFIRGSKKLLPGLHDQITEDDAPTSGSQPAASTSRTSSNRQIATSSSSSGGDLICQQSNDGRTSILPVEAGKVAPAHEEAQKLSFSDVLKPLLPPHLSEAHTGTTDESLMDRAREIGKSSWNVFKQTLKIIKEASAPFPQPQVAVGALIAILEQYDIVADAKEDYSRVSHKLAALQLILSRYSASETLPSTRDRLQGLSNWIESLAKGIESQISRGWHRRILTGPEDRRRVTELLQSLTTAIDFFMLDMSIESKHDQERMSTDAKRFEMKIDDLTDSHLLDKLKHVAEAGFIAQKEPPCLPGTRMKLLDEIMGWCTDASRPRVFWLSGMAGTGKSAIARTLCDQLTRTGLLGGSFFCSRRGTADQRDVQRIIPTLARHLCRLDVEYRRRVVECLERDSDIVSATVERQLEKLIVEPCAGNTSFNSLSTPLILVIDALDEGSQADDIARLLEAIFKQVHASRAAIPLRFLLTSRPESHIRDKFRYSTDASQHATFYLHQIEETIVRADIRLYLKYRLENINKEKNRLPTEWPENEQIEALVDRADKLFIYAFLACNFIERNPRRRLQKIIETSCSDEQSLTERLDQMYTLVLDEAKSPSLVDSDITATIEKCLIVLIFIPKVFSLTQLSSFIETDVQDIEIAVDELHSLILLPPSADEAITTLHASFGDYLTHQRRSGKHFISTVESRLLLLQRCFEIMDSELCFNVAKARTSFLRNKEQNLALPRHLIYASENWLDHIIEKGSKEQSAVIVAWIEKTLLPKFLFWLEVFSVTGNVESVNKLLEKLLPFVETKPEVTKFILDGIQFVTDFQQPISQSLPHIYLSALPFASQRRIMPTMDKFYLNYTYMARIEYIEFNDLKERGVFPAWFIKVYCVAISLDGTCIASGSDDSMVRLWNAKTGSPIMHLLQGHTSVVCSLTFSPDGNLIASGSRDTAVRVWDVQTGQLTIGPLRGHIDGITSLEFSPDGIYIVSGSKDTTVRIWNARTGDCVMQTPPLTQEGTPLVFRLSNLITSNGNQIQYTTKSCRDIHVHMWNIQNIQCTAVNSDFLSKWDGPIAFSPDGACIVSATFDGTVHVWDIGTGQIITRLSHRSLISGVTSVAFLLDGTCIVLGTNDSTPSLAVYNALTGDHILGPLHGHTSLISSVKFSVDGTRIVSGSHDGTVRVWDITTAQSIPSRCVTDPQVIQDNTSQLEDVAASASMAIPVNINIYETTNTFHQVFPFKLSRNPFSNYRHVPDPRDLFTINVQSGWITGPSNELLIWIPKDLRSSLYMPRTVTVMSSTRWALNLSNFAYGLDWTTCKRSIHN